jgi:hypothetical protein
LESIDERMLAFVAWHGEVPCSAHRIEDHEARKHAATWIRRNVGERAVSYIIAYALGDRWWTLFFDRVDSLAPEGAERWHVESYNHDGRSWAGDYYYWPATSRWRHVLHLYHGEGYGRHAPTTVDS